MYVSINEYIHIELSNNNFNESRTFIIYKFNLIMDESLINQFIEFKLYIIVSLHKTKMNYVYMYNV